MKYLFSVLFSFTLLLPSLSFAQQKVYSLVFPIPEVTDEVISQSPGISKDTLIVNRSREISSKLASLMKKRLKSASIKDSQVEVNNFHVTVKIGGKDANEPRIIELLSSPSRVEIRPVLPSGGPHWSLLSHAIPKSVLVVGNEQNQYLWSSNLNELNETLVAAAMIDLDYIPRENKPAKYRLIAAPEQDKLGELDRTVVKDKNGGGWRSFLLGPVVATTDDVEKTSWKMDSVGGYSTTVSLRRPISLPKDVSSKVAVMIDDELVAILPGEKVGAQFKLSPPKGLSKNEQRVWARATAGRFASEISIPFGLTAPTEEKENIR